MQSDIKKTNWMKQGISSGWITDYELQMLQFLEAEYGTLDEEERLCVLFASLFLNSGHTMLPLDKSVAELASVIEIPEEDVALLPDIRVTSEKLLNGKIVAANSSEMKPLLLQHNTVAFRRYAVYENNLLQWIEEKNRSAGTPFISSVQTDLLNRLFGEPNADEPDWQKTAAALSLLKPFLIVSGGPGTGKTTTVAKMLLLHQRLQGGKLNIALAAPTGKAAGRMGEALNRELEKLEVTDEELRGIPREAKTVHRLLIPVRDEGLLPSAEEKKLNYDLIVVDEASMVDLSLMHRLFTHLHKNTRLVLLGDRDQLASVEAGSVFADLCRKKENGFTGQTISLLKQLGIAGELMQYNGRPLDDAIVYLTKSYRFDEKSGIGALSAAVKQPNSDPAKIFESFDDLHYTPFAYSGSDMKTLVRHFETRIREVQSKSDPSEMLDFWKLEAWLTVLRRGLSGSEKLNALVEQKSLSAASGRRKEGWYHGRPVIITKNDYDLEVFNGDIGVCVREEDRFFVYVESGSKLKRIAADRLAHAEPAFFLTVHKSQGSEFEAVHLLLPPKDTRVLTRELIYTAITRAKKSFALYGEMDLFETGRNRLTERYTGFSALFG